MRLIAPIFAVLLTSAAYADETPILTQPCAANQAGCEISKQDQKRAKKAFEKGLKFEREHRNQEAFEAFDQADQLVPHDVNYSTAKEILRQQRITDHIRLGNQDLTSHHAVEALAEFRTAIQLDPTNEFALQRLKDMLGDYTPPVAVTVVPNQKALSRADDSAEPVKLQPNPGEQVFHYRGDSRGLLTQVAQQFGLVITVDDSVQSRSIVFNLDRADFYTAMQAACDMTKTFWTPLEEKQILVAQDSPESRRAFERMGYRTFYVSGANAPQDLNDISNLLRNLFDVRFVSVQAASSTITVRAPSRILDAATRLLAGVDQGKPQVLLDVKVFAIDHTFVRKLGLSIPNQFQAFNIPAAALASLGGQNIQDLINQLIANGGINQASQSAISALLAQQSNQQNSLFSQPVATFGGGKTLFGVALGTVGGQLSLNESDVVGLEHVTLRASQGNEAKFLLGSRIPILNAQFAPVFNTSAIAKVIGNSSYQAPFPSFNYEDIGLDVKAKPTIHTNGDVSLDFDLSIKALAGQSLNGVPVLSNRAYKGQITVQDGQSAVVAGFITLSEQGTRDGIPAFGQIPLLRKATSNNERDETQNELLVVVTPHIVKNAERDAAAEIWLSPAH
jgi:type II secretory pathway component GspD/PulD (secretin)